MKDVKVIANYLPQYHQMKENDEWWGKGYTDWVGVKKAKPQFEGHLQPRIPLNHNYYDLAQEKNIRWQAELAAKYGIYGFGIYHYWFSSRQHFMETPSNIIFNNKDIPIHYMFIWDNTSWIRSWSAVKGNNWAPSEDQKKDHQGNGILAELKYGDKEEWKAHFDFLLPYFKDERYVKIDGKPVFCFMRFHKDPEIIRNMSEYWDELAKQAGLPGVCCMSKNNWKGDRLEYSFDYEPFQINNKLELLTRSFGEMKARKKPQLRRMSYDVVWRDILNGAKLNRNPKSFYSGVVGFDDTPRRGNHARILDGQSPQKFEKYLHELIDLSRKNDKELVFVTAWNEWGEGAYLEPDETNGYAYLEALRKALG